MKKRIASWTAVALVAMAGGLFAYRASTAGVDRADCPGKVICPIMGQEICKDQCPLTNADRPDCPGKIVCPLTGEIICRDRCPLGKDRAKTAATPGCCAGGK